MYLTSIIIEVKNLKEYELLRRKLPAKLRWQSGYYFNSKDLLYSTSVPFAFKINLSSMVATLVKTPMFTSIHYNKGEIYSYVSGILAVNNYKKAAKEIAFKNITI